MKINVIVDVPDGTELSKTSIKWQVIEALDGDAWAWNYATAPELVPVSECVDRMLKADSDIGVKL